MLLERRLWICILTASYRRQASGSALQPKIGNQRQASVEPRLSEAEAHWPTVNLHLRSGRICQRTLPIGADGALALARLQ